MNTTSLAYALRAWPCLFLAALPALPPASAATTDDVYLLGPDSRGSRHRRLFVPAGESSAASSLER
jgi:hypothetical protein